jgi:hypothetical protein
VLCDWFNAGRCSRSPRSRPRPHHCVPGTQPTPNHPPLHPNFGPAHAHIPAHPCAVRPPTHVLLQPAGDEVPWPHEEDPRPHGGDGVPAAAAHHAFDLARMCAGGAVPADALALGVSGISRDLWSVLDTGQASYVPLASGLRCLGGVPLEFTLLCCAAREDVLFPVEGGAGTPVLPRDGTVWGGWGLLFGTRCAACIDWFGLWATGWWIWAAACGLRPAGRARGLGVVAACCTPCPRLIFPIEPRRHGAVHRVTKQR